MYMRRFIVEISSRDYGGWDIPRAAVCKPKNQESQWHNSVCVWTPRSRGADAVSPSPKARDQEHRCLRAEKDGCRRSSRESKFTLPLTCSIEAFNGVNDAPFLSSLVLTTFFTQFMYFNADLFQRYHHRSHTNNVLPAYRASLSLVKLTYKINKLTWQFSYIFMKRIRQLFVFNYHKRQEGERGLWGWLAGKYHLFEDQGLGQFPLEMIWAEEETDH